MVSRRQCLAGLLGKTSKRLGVADGDVGEDLAVELDTGTLEAVNELRVGQPVQARAALIRMIQSLRKSRLRGTTVAERVQVGLQHRCLAALY